DRLYNEFIVKNNIQVFDAPAAYPQYTADYYAVFFADPDGVKLEYAFYT
ncbi:MAG: VOC family protein, partial [Parcubacteria group bacterium]|nr:VOC family protein [Parcubacteria group bacterium]